jgi:hypothetical protein
MFCDVQQICEYGHSGPRGALQWPMDNTKSEPNDCIHTPLSARHARSNAAAMSKSEVWIRVSAPAAPSMNIFWWHCVYTVLDGRLPLALGAHFADEAPTTLGSCRRQCTLRHGRNAGRWLGGAAHPSGHRTNRAVLEGGRPRQSPPEAGM